MTHRLALFATFFSAIALGCGGSGTTPPAAAFNGCSASQFVDRTANTAPRVISYGGANGSGPYSYDPPCMTIAAGQNVTISGGTISSFGTHPLSPGVPGNPDAGTPRTPIPRVTDGTVREVMVDFPTPGTYPFFCELHGAGGMTGVVQVR